MNVDLILDTLNRHHVDYLLIGGMNFLLRHQPALTFDVDVWIDDTDENRARCEAALGELGAEWGRTDAERGPVANRAPGWLAQQGVFSVNSAPRDRSMSSAAWRGWQPRSNLEPWPSQRERSRERSTLD